MNTRSTKAKARKATAGGSPRGIKARIIKALGLQPLPGEGGYYRETYRSGTQVPIPSKNGEQPVIRHLGTAIYYFVTPREFSALHKLKSDEVFHFYGGDPVEMLQISESGEVKTIILGPDVLAGHQPQVTVPAGTWQGTRLLKGGKYALMGTTVYPAFEFADFELGKRADMIARFPKLAALIKRFTRE
ncbi:MAG: cupin domain-containing protein [Elusimicrobia bacterium]|nr:cupin domain-containing protein [Elusimicrobiota bacterium]